MYARIALFSQPYSTLTYALPTAFPESFWRPGLRLAVPLGKNTRSIRAGCILETMASPDLPPGAQCKMVLWPLETEQLINGQILELARDLATRQGIEPGGVLGRVLPPDLRSASIKTRCLDKGQNLSIAEIANLGPDAQAELAKNLLCGKAYISHAPRDQASQEFCLLNADPPWPLRPAAKMQISILDFLHENGMASRRALLKKLGARAAQPLKKLLEAGLIRLELGLGEEDAQTDLLAPPPAPFELNLEQKQALAEIEKAMKSGSERCALLYGVTGSGKTAVYLESVKLCLASGRSALLLAPEVALAHKLYQDAAQVLPKSQIALYHGYQHPAKREAIYRQLAAAKEARLVIGTRSALFLPLANPGCVILDEEHDGSFKQDERLAYHAKEVAWFRMKQNRGLLLLGSATPDIKTFHACQNGALPMLRLSRRAGKAQLPPVEIADIGAGSGLQISGLQAAGGRQSLLSPTSEQALLDCLAEGGQAVILLNRRGYAPLVYCVDCAKTLRCPHCEIGLNFHKSINKLVCHYCNYSIPFPSPCPVCGGMNYLALGEGTERLAEKLEALAGKPILRLDRDNARREGSIDEILGAFARGESPFLAGTQMLSKGHHFPNVTLVIVADGDIGLNLPDYRAAERSFQLLAQSAGRAGRGEKAGRVIIQTRNPNHYFWPYVQNYDYEGFYEDELARRKRMLYPPFTRLALLRLSFPADNAEGPKALAEIAGAIRKKSAELGIRALGPAPAPIAMLRGKKRFQCLLKCPQWRDARQVYFAIKNSKAAKGLDIFLDLDPVNML